VSSRPRRHRIFTNFAAGCFPNLSWAKAVPLRPLSLVGLAEDDQRLVAGVDEQMLELGGGGEFLHNALNGGVVALLVVIPAEVVVQNEIAAGACNCLTSKNSRP